ncbi:unnamed protein product [Prunus armeniaca]
MFTMPPRRELDGRGRGGNNQDDFERLAQQIERLTRQMKTLMVRQQQEEDDYEHETNPFSEDNRMEEIRHNNNYGTRRWEVGLRIDIPEFHGSLQLEDFLDWLNSVEEVLEFKDVPENIKVSLIATRFRGRASAWWQQFKATHLRQGK